jgi:ABC-type dipeptide/oligopeptide/nickel transport system permease subunit
MATAFGSYVTSTLLKSRAGITDSTDDTLLGVICDQVNSFIESSTGRVLAPISGTPTYTYDGDGSPKLWLPKTTTAYVGGVRSITTLELADYTGASYSTVTAGDYFLRGLSGPAGSYEWLWMSDRPTGTFRTFADGFATVRITGTFGYAAIPDDIAEVAVTIAVRAWHARENGQQDIVGTDEFGRSVVSRVVSVRDRDTLRRYSLVDGLV